MNFNLLEEKGRIGFKLSFTNNVIFIYGGKLGSRFIDASMEHKNKYQVMIDLSKAPQIKVEAKQITKGEAKSGVNCEETSKFVKSVLEGKSNKRDIIFVYRDPWEKYKSGIYQDFPSQYKNVFQKKDVLKYFDTLILEERPNPPEMDLYFDVYDLKGAVFTGHSQRVLNSYKAILDKTKIDINRCQFFNMGIYDLKSVLEKYIRGNKHELIINKMYRNRDSWTENKVFRDFFYNTFEPSLYSKVVKKIMKTEIELYNWFESHKRNFTNLHKATIKK